VHEPNHFAERNVKKFIDKSPIKAQQEFFEGDPALLSQVFSHGNAPAQSYHALITFGHQHDSEVLIPKQIELIPEDQVQKLQQANKQR